MSATRPKPTGRVPYKTYLSLMPVEWDQLREEAQRRKISGREVIEAALSQYCHSLPRPAPRVFSEEPLPEDKGD